MTLLVILSITDWAVSLVVRYKSTDWVAGCRTLQDGDNGGPTLGAYPMCSVSWTLGICRLLVPTV